MPEGTNITAASHDRSYCEQFREGCTCVDCPACEGTGEDALRSFGACPHCFGNGWLPASEARSVPGEMERREEAERDAYEASMGDHEAARFRARFGGAL